MYPYLKVPLTYPILPLNIIPQVDHWRRGVGVWEGLKYDRRILEQPVKDYYIFKTEEKLFLRGVQCSMRTLTE